MIEIIGNEFLYRAEELSNSPSTADNIDYETTLEVRLRACHVAKELLKYCDSDQMTVCTALLFIQRFYCRRSVAAYEYKVFLILYIHFILNII